MMEKLNVGMVGTYQLNFQGDKLGELRKTIGQMEELAKVLDFNFYPIRDGLVTKEDAERARKELDAHDVDFTLIQNSSFSAGEIIPPLVKVKGRIGLWALPEPTQEGPLPLNSFCGMNMYGSIIGHYLKEHEIPFKWFYGYVDDELFRPRFEVTLRTLRAIKGLRNARIGLVGGIAPGFDDFYFDERTLERRFGTRIFRSHEFSEIMQKAEKYDEKLVEELREAIKSEAVACEVDNETLAKSARAYLALQEIAQENGYEALAISCWPKFQNEYEIAPCSTIGRLNETGLVAACEGDVPSALSMLLLNYLNNDQSMLMDLSAFDESDQTVLFWHCGPAAKRWADQERRGMRLAQHSVVGIERPGEPIKRVGTVNDMVFKPQETTIMRITKEGQAMLVLTADIVEETKKSFDGSRGWFGNLKLNGEDITVRDLVNTIMVHRFQHHYPIAKGNLTEELMEVAAWLAIKPLEKLPYQRYMQQPHGTAC